MAKRKAREITNPKDLNEILSLTHEKASEKSVIMDFFADFGDGPRFNPYDIIEVPEGYYGATKKNKNSFKTTIGIWIFNKSFIEPMADVLGYYNQTINGKTYDAINSKISYGVIEGTITIEQLKHFIMQTQILMSCTSAICPSHTMDMILLTTKAEKKKKEIEAKYKNEIENNDLVAMKAVEDELIAWAKDQLKDSESVDMYNSGARSSWDNNFKNMYLVKGPAKLTDGSYAYISSSYISGLDKKDLAVTNDAAVGGPYSRSKKTQEGGYLEKQFTNATQHISLLPKGSNCNTKRTLKVKLDSKNIEDWMYSFIVNSDGSLTEITSTNKNKFIGKTVNMRYSALCEAKNGKVCEACMGTLFNRIGITNVGLGTMVMMSSLKNKAMKAFHDSTLNMATINPEDIF